MPKRLSNKKKGKKPYILLLSITAVALVFLFTYIMSPPQEEEPVWTAFNEINLLEAGEIKELIIHEADREMQVVIEEQQLIQEFSALLAPLELQQKGDSELRPGWTHTADLYFTEEDYLRMVFAGNSLELDFFGDVPLTVKEKVQEGEYTTNKDFTEELNVFFADVLEEQEEKPVKIEIEEIEPAISIVINNHPAARPSSGLQKVDIIYEFLVEGGSTRYLAVYKSYHDESFEIGPIRSLRPYFGVQSQEHGGIIAHSGYSARTREMIQGLGLYQIADYGDNFWRDGSRRAPHNLYTSINNLYNIAEDEIQVKECIYTLDREEEENERNYNKKRSIEIEYSPHNVVRYEYDEEEEVYYRFINDEPHTDRETGEQYHAGRVIVRETPHRNVPGPEGLVDIELRGSGEGLLYERGRKYNITWERDNEDTVYRYLDGDKVEYLPVTTWVQVVRQ